LTSDSWQESTLLKVNDNGRFVIDNRENTLLQANDPSCGVDAVHPGDTVVSLDGGSDGHCALRDGEFRTHTILVR
jgi:hypothetical protein